MTDLPTRMREAAEVLEEASARYELAEPTFTKALDQRTWNASGLRSFADTWAAKDADLVELSDKLTDLLRRQADLITAWHGGPIVVLPEGVRSILANYDIKKK